MQSKAKVPFSLMLVAISIALPEEFSFYIFDLRFTVTRLLFIVLTPFIVFRLIQKIGAGRYHFLLPDVFVLLSGFWMVLAPSIIMGFASGLNHGGPIALEFCIGYFATRVLLSKPGQGLKFISLFCGVIAIASLLALLDPLTGSFAVHHWAGAVTGYDKFLHFAGEHRYGLLRAMGPFEHSIIFGMLSSLALLIACYVNIEFRKFCIAWCAVGMIAALSSAPVQGFLIGVGLLIYDRIFWRLSFKWLILLALCAGTVGAVSLSGHSVLHFIITNLIYDPMSGYDRIWTWAWVSRAVDQSPLFGLGFGPYPDDLNISHSIDALWLVLALDFGLPGAILIGLSLIGGATLPVSSRQIDLSPEEKKLGVVLGIVISVILFMSIT